MNGLIRQWGTQKATEHQKSTVAFYVPFSNGNSYYINFITQKDGNDEYYRHQVTNKNGSSCTVHDYNINTSNFFDWLAIGN